MIVDQGLHDRLARIRLLVCDVDGTLTDGAMYYGEGGEVLKRFHTRDGHGIGRLRSAGVVVALVTTEETSIVSARAAKLQLTHVIMACADKGAAIVELQRALGVGRAETAMIGDDLGDLPGFEAAGLAVAVADAESSVRAAADVVCERAGGEGAVRELADAILHAREQSGS